MLTTFTFGERLMIYRKRLGLSKEALAEKITVDAETVRRYEDDEKMPDAETMTRLAELFNKSIEGLIYGC